MLELLGHKYEIVKGKENIIMNDLESLFTDYFLSFDYVVGDYSYNKLRLKGFYDSKSKQVKSINNIDNLDEYIKIYCSYGAKTFLIKCIDR